jgi:Diaphanous GTPase-binding Domain/Diaphanous FH3 Domain
MATAELVIAIEPEPQLQQLAAKKKRGLVSDPSFLFGNTILPSDQELDTMMELFMEDVNLAEDKKSLMRTLNSDRKWMMLVQNLSERFRSGSQEVIQEIIEIQKLRQEPNEKIVHDLVVSLRSRPIRWINEFVEHGGLAVLLDQLNELEESETHNQLEQLYLLCLKSFMNNKVGLSAVLDTDGALAVIGLCLRSNSLHTKTLVLEIFGAVCLLPGGHTPVLDGLEALCEVTASRFRFESIIYLLWSSCQGCSPEQKELQVACMAFINAVTCGGDASELAFRMHIRWEFINLGLMQLIDKIGVLENEILQTQIDVWISSMENDEAELYSRLTGEVGKPMPQDPFEFTKLVFSNMQETSSGTPFISVLRHMTLLPTNSFERLKFMLLISRCVEKIAFYKPGEISDPDPASALDNLDIEGVLVRLH